MTFQDHIKRCNAWTPHLYRPLSVAGHPVGMVRHDHAEALSTFPDIFTVTSDTVRVAATHKTPAQRTQAAAQVLDTLTAQGKAPRSRHELYAVRTAFHNPDLMQIDRGYVAMLGLLAWGIHVNGYVRQPDGRIMIWTGIRSASKTLDPGKLDSMIAGGQPASLSLLDNLRKEAAEEAGMPADIAAAARPVGTVSYMMDNAWGIRRDTLFCFDLELPASFVPRNTDGEIERFELIPAEELIEQVRRSQDAKFNVALVILDFALRHGLLDPEKEPDYESLVRGLRAPLSAP